MGKEVFLVNRIKNTKTNKKNIKKKEKNIKLTNKQNPSFGDFTKGVFLVNRSKHKKKNKNIKLTNKQNPSFGDFTKEMFLVNRSKNTKNKKTQKKNFLLRRVLSSFDLRKISPREESSHHFIYKIF